MFDYLVPYHHVQAAARNALSMALRLPRHQYPSRHVDLARRCQTQSQPVIIKQKQSAYMTTRNSCDNIEQAVAFTAKARSYLATLWQPTRGFVRPPVKLHKQLVQRHLHVLLVLCVPATADGVDLVDEDYTWCVLLGLSHARWATVSPDRFPLLCNASAHFTGKSPRNRPSLHFLCTVF